MKPLEVYIDGASKGNPGPGGIGVQIRRGQEDIRSISVYIGKTTNNVAEYTALIYGLQEALILGEKNIVINTDSELLCKQINKIYKVKSAGIKPLYEQAMRLMAAFSQVSVRHIPREKNRGADMLATRAVKEATKAKAL